MRIAIVDAYYSRFLAAHDAGQQARATASFDQQRASLLGAAFGTSDFYSRHLNAMGHEAVDLIVNCVPLQERWAQENGYAANSLAMKVPPKLFRVPVVGRFLSALPGLASVAEAQIRSFRPDILYCQDLTFFSSATLRRLKRDVRLVVGQIASPLPPVAFLDAYDLILTSFPHFVPRLKAMNIAAEYFRIGFDPRVLQLLGEVSKDVDASFVGGISRHHGKAVPMLEYLARNTPIEFFGYGAGGLDAGSPIRSRHRGEVWGMDMYRALARSRVTLNRHINVAENNANNMRLYEATGVGTLLITDRKDNLGELFEVGKEVVAYSDKEEAAELIRYYLAHPAEAQAIARAGQQRTLGEHTYRHRMQELVPILERYLSERGSFR